MRRQKILTSRPERYEPDTEIKKRPLAFVDLEFSGLELQHEVLQIGCVLVSQPDFRVIREWKRDICPRHLATADRHALRVIHYSPKEIADAVPLRQALKEFNHIARGAVLVGYNVSWDFLFLKKAYHEAKIRPSFHWQVLDVLSMAFEKLYRARMRGYRMKELGHYLKIKNGKWHDALDDAETTYHMFLQIMKR